MAAFNSIQILCRFDTATECMAVDPAWEVMLSMIRRIIINSGSCDQLTSVSSATPPPKKGRCDLSCFNQFL
eukprot:scaffold526_cov251-Chaetoceros_neogracile.AAC.2